MSELAKIIKDNPGCYIYYHDNGSWTLYTSKNDFENYNDLDEDFDEITLYEGSDFDCCGYAPELVIVLAKNLGIEVDSI